MTTLQNALKPFADFADPRTTVSPDLVITNGSKFAKRQLTMGDCYRARDALAEDASGWPTGELLKTVQAHGGNTTNLQSTETAMLKITQDLSVPEAIRKSARTYLTIMSLRSQPPHTVPAFFTQDEVLALMEIIAGALLFPDLDETRAARLRSARKALTFVFLGAPDPVPTDRPLRWDRPQGAKKGECFVDVSGTGRYLVRRSGPRGFVATLNGKPTEFKAAKSEDVVAMVERSVRAQRMGSKRVEVLSKDTMSGLHGQPED